LPVKYAFAVNDEKHTVNFLQYIFVIKMELISNVRNVTIRRSNCVH